MKRFLVWSNSFFIVPLVFSIYYELYLHAATIFFVIIFSVCFHKNPRKNDGIYDKFFAYILIFYNFYLFYLANFEAKFFYPALTIVLVGGLFYFKDRKKEYPFYHSLWHIASSAITFLAVLAYAV